MVDEKYIGMALAMSSSLLIGTSFVLTKKGLMEAASRYGSATEGLQYFKNVLWWAGMVTMGLGEFANFAAYSFAPAILVTPLGALSVIVGAILASIFLGERINTVGKAGCALCLMGSVIVVLNAPRDGDIESVEQIMNMVMQPPFLIYSVVSLSFVIFMITKVASKYGQQNPLVYLSICSIAGSMTVTACKAFGIALKLTFAGNNQFVHLSTYVFAGVVVMCIVVQMNYFNKALEQFETNIVTPIYYVFFTSATILASVALFQGFTDSTNKEMASLFCGFITIFIGVFLLNSTKSNNDGATGNNGQHQPLPTEEPGRRLSTFSSRGRVSLAAASFDISDFEDNASGDGDHESYPMRERRRTIDSEKGFALNRHPTLPKSPRTPHWYRKNSGDDTNDGETTDVQSSTSRSNSAGSYSHVSPTSPAFNDDIHVDIPLSPSIISHRRKSLHRED
ncbi:hypothetical protein IW140_001230 [Coemansia sp. RSA 1813]|nr:hypothetical protein EV178_001180 [Coemansia sp. RSA 1646]KAJ1772164.1 hypothetical protein LPJ74_001749 [Coemansia sp. RSA 1843]KAJ2091718.1 hypothetical protein IW138_001701 [Coemansia sp. RSA 986]KAJ2216879.1 hypothetical protein EV179_000913 [Coemansia sp. RSA 487]KAJ2571881.1 hypothetical protein IW140_001230 [Coemansia sp. RSA 1813]